MSDLLPSLLVVVALLAGGLGWLALTGWRTRCGPETLGYAFAAGAAWTGVLVALLAPIPGALTPVTLIGGAALPAGWMAWRRPRLSVRPGWLGFLPALAAVALSLWLAAQRPVWNVDALRRWGLHAQWTAAEGTATPARVADESWAPSHPRYPPLLPGVLAAGLYAGADASTGLRPLMPWFFAALLGVAYGFAWRRARGEDGGTDDARAGPWRAHGFATLPTTALALTPCFLWGGLGKGMLTGFGADALLADVPLALFVTATAAALLAQDAQPRARAWVAAWCAAGAALTKQEGFVLVVALLLVALGAGIVARLRGASRAGPEPARTAGTVPARLPLAAALAAGLGWRVVARRMPVAEGEDYLSSEALAALPERLDRLPTVLGRSAQELLRLELWGPLWIVAALAAACWIARRTHGAGLLLAWILAGHAVVVVAFTATGWQGGAYERLMDVSLTRLLMHHAPLVALLVATQTGAPAAASAAPSAPAATRLRTEDAAA